MSEQIFPANQNVKIIFLALQVLQVLFLWLHDWIPLGPTERRRRRTQPRHNATPCRCNFYPKCAVLHRPIVQRVAPWATAPPLASMWLCISYSFIFVRQIRVWWISYLLHAEPERTARYQVMFGKPRVFCQLIMVLSREQGISCFMLRPLPRCLSCS